MRTRLASLMVVVSFGCSGTADTPDAAGSDAAGSDAVIADGSHGDDAELADAGDRDGGSTIDEGWPVENAYSWNGSWTPSPAELPPDGLFDDEYFDGHAGSDGMPTPILPPGAWDWNDADDDLANWRNFSGNLGRFESLRDDGGRAFGWRLLGNVPDAVDYSGPAAYFEGSPGTDVMDLGPSGSVHSFAEGNLGDGPDVLVFDGSYSLDFRTGSSDRGAAHDDDLVIAGCTPTTGGAFDVLTTTIHTGPGADWVFARDLSRAAIDLGNGEGGRTDRTDPRDGSDLVVLRGNTHDFRVYGGRGDDVVVWHVDENEQTTTWLGPNFFGGGGAGAALWDDGGIDRLVLDVPTSTVLVGAVETPEGALSVRGTDGGTILDDPTQGDPFAAYCVECGEGPLGRRTVIFEYRSTGGTVHTGYFYVTAFEELQIGVGAGARVLRIDDVAGALVETSSAAPTTAPTPPDDLCR